jgi:hypothetical protein
MEGLTVSVGTESQFSLLTIMGEFEAECRKLWAWKMQFLTIFWEN